jgi:hypothetical protein
MRGVILFPALMIFCTFAAGQALTLADAKSKNAVQLSADDLKQLLPGAKVTTKTPTGSTRNWENTPDGHFVASTDGRGSAYSNNRTLPTTGSGEWRIDDKGAYCVTIQWGTMKVSEDWCRYIFKADAKYFTFATLDDTARAWEFEISK